MIKNACKDKCQDTYRPPLRLGAGRLCGLLADAGLLADGLAGGGGWLEAYAAGWRMLAFLGAGEARREGQPPGRWSACGGLLGGLLGAICAAAGGLPGMDGAGDGPAAICGGNSAVFNQLLTIFLVVAMVWRFPVFFLCSYCLFRRALPGR